MMSVLKKMPALLSVWLEKKNYSNPGTIFKIYFIRQACMHVVLKHVFIGSINNGVPPPPQPASSGDSVPPGIESEFVHCVRLTNV